MDSLKLDNNVKRQATFETEPADTVVGRSIKRGDINLPFIDANAVKNGTKDPKGTVKQEQLKVVKEKERKEKELQSLKEKKEKELKALKDRELKKVQLNKINHDKGSKETVQSQKDKELKALKDKEAKAKTSKDIKSEKEKELKAKKEDELKAKKEKELKEQQEKATKLKDEKEKQVKASEKGKKLDQANQRNGNQNGNKSTSTKEKEGEGKVGFFHKLGRSLSPSKNKQTPPVDTTDPVPSAKSKTNPRGDKTPPQVLVVDDDRFAEVRVATPTVKSSEGKEEAPHFKAAPPRKNKDDDSLRSETNRITESHKNDSGSFSERVDTRAKPRVVQSKMDAWMNEKRGSQGSIDSQRMQALRKLNTNSPRNSLPDDEEVPVIKDSKADYLKSKGPPEKSRRKYPGDVSSSLESDIDSAQEPYDHVLAERDCLLTAEVAYKRRIYQLEGETNQLAEALDKRDNEIKELKWNIENPSTVTEVSVLTQKLQNEVDKLQQELDELKKEKKKYKILHQDSERKMTEVVIENDDLREKLILFEQDRIPQVEDLQKENKKLESSLKLLKTKLKESEEQFDFLKNENIEMSGEISMVLVFL
ncbi:hypothetical protein LOTGIDRAFT_156349 [Lottia gigantea]|uniref:Uncharacterized protein n=1 Tax=Lottia gigantea TaxID=225164 RepID=V4BCD0_LOTGI|nr:hypothetical protein LOTGIDRAFT_156349 [Lottia gigantea]ESP03787.1 hypothetical protein LOTGIDRAFT_156349 [Lottia gigantea]